MKFIDFLETYYLPSQIELLTKQLVKLAILEPIKATIEGFYAECPVKEPDAFKAQLILTISDFTTIVNTTLSKLSNNDKKVTIQIELTKLGVYLIKETYEVSKYKKLKYFKMLRATLQKVYKKHHWNFTELDNLLHLERIEQFATENEVKTNAKAIKSKVVSFEWNSPKPIDLFYADVKTYFKLKTTNELNYLFQNIISDFSIALHPKYLLQFIVLFDKLHQTSTISIKGSRGIFIYLKQHLIATNGSFPLKDFRKLKYELKEKEKEYKAIETAINKAFDKYYPASTIGR